mgnify:CR=1 FL=1
MSIIALSVICFIIGYVTWETIKYNKIKKQNERDNKKRCCDSKKKKQKPKRYKKVSKIKTQNKRKSNSAKEEIEE